MRGGGLQTDRRSSACAEPDSVGHVSPLRHPTDYDRPPCFSAPQSPRGDRRRCPKSLLPVPRWIPINAILGRLSKSIHIWRRDRWAKRSRGESRANGHHRQRRELDHSRNSDARRRRLTICPSSSLILLYTRRCFLFLRLFSNWEKKDNHFLSILPC